MQLPDVLEKKRTNIESAFLSAVPSDWPEGEAFMWADQAQALAQVLIPVLHEHLVNARLAYLFKESMKLGPDRIKLGTAQRAAAQLEYLSDHDFVLTFNHEAWRTLSMEQRIALVDHELCHCGCDLEKSRFGIMHHDVEEFGAVIRRWGLWKPDLANFGKDVAEKLGQGDLFATVLAKSLGDHPEQTGLSITR
jgi:hypothetical protein